MKEYTVTIFITTDRKVACNRLALLVETLLNCGLASANNPGNVGENELFDARDSKLATEMDFEIRVEPTIQLDESCGWCEGTGRRLT